MTSVAKKLMKISDLASESGLPISTVRHYINEGLLGNPRKTSKNMAYYDRDSIPRISLIKRLQNELFLPLKVIKKLLLAREDLSFGDYDIIVEVRKRLSEYDNLLPQMAGIPHSEVMKHMALTEEEMLTLQELGVVCPEVKEGERAYDEVDYRTLKALSDFRASGFSADLGFSTDDLGLYLRIIKTLAKIESRLFTSRIAKGRSAEEIADLIRKGLPAVNEVISSLHHKFMMEELKGMEESAKEKVTS